MPFRVESRWNIDDVYHWLFPDILHGAGDIPDLILNNRRFRNLCWRGG
jgi:hypothetical protein